MCYTHATCHEAKRKSVSIITVKAATQVSTLEGPDALLAEVSPQYSPTSPPDLFRVNYAMESAEQVTDSLVAKKPLPATKGTVRNQFWKPHTRLFELSYF